MMEIWKYRLRVGSQTITMPSNARVVHVGSQDGNITIWAEVDPNSDQMPQDFEVLGTGHPIPLNCRHVGTALVPPFVWHVYQSVLTERS